MNDKALVTILIVDDDLTSRNALSERLSALGYRPLGAASLAEAETHLKNQPQLVLLKLPLRNEAANAWITARRDHQISTPIIIYGSRENGSVLLEALRAGAADYLYLPVGDSGLLDHSLTRTLTRARLQAQNRQYQAQLKQTAESQLQTLERNEQLFKHTLDNLLVGVVVHAADTSILLSNPEASRILGLSEEQMQGKKAIDPSWRFVDENLKPMPVEDYPVMQVARKRTTLKNLLLGIQHPERDYTTWVIVNATPVWDSQGEMNMVAINFIDITERREVVRKLMRERAKLRTIIDSMPAMVYVKDRTGVYQEANLAQAAALHSPIQEVIGKTEDVLNPDASEAMAHWQEEQKILSRGGEGKIEEQIILRDGNREHWQTIRVPFTDQEGEKALLGIAMDVTELRRYQEEVSKLSQALEQSPLAVLLTTQDGRIHFSNPSAERMLQELGSDLEGACILELLARKNPPERLFSLEQAIVAGGNWEGELQHAEDRHAWIQANMAPVRDRNGHISDHLFLIEDISLKRQQEEQILYQAHFDSLTDLPNRLLATDRLNQAILRASQNSHPVSLMFIDLDDFKKVNDSLGHDIGDQLLIQAARRLQDAVRPGDTVARQGGDEFLVILEQMHYASEAIEVANRILKAFRQPFLLNHMSLLVTPSIGISRYPDDGSDATTLLRNADLAMYQSKRYGGSQVTEFNARLNQESIRRLQIEQHLQHAVERHELELTYQPIIDTRKRTISGVEALLRWRNPELGYLMPDYFIPVAEQTGLIVAMGHWVITTAARQVAAWNQEYGCALTLAVNVSPRQFRHSTLLPSVEKALATGLLPHQLELEVTEGLLLRNEPETLDLLHRIRALGCHFSMDDFGTGYSSLSYLKNLPFTSLKIDRSFVRDLLLDAGDQALVKATIQMAKGLGLSVIGEGVEEEAQLTYLAREGCDRVQGYFFSRPIAAEELEKDFLTAKAWPEPE